ncbi:RNA polymerase sigma factor [Litoreibacter sp.]|nr:RNA polymerase sigma factor [Litoreibacter sp.]
MEMALDQVSETSDDALLVLYANGDPVAASELTARLAPRLLSFCNRMLRDLAEAEDVVQEAMLRLWKMAPEWVPGAAKPSTWLFRVASNLCTDRLRKKRGVGLDQIAEPIDDTPGAEARLMQAERLSALDMALETLPERQRQAVVLRHIEGMSNPEIAQILDISVEAVESLTARGKRALATELASRKEELGL